ncbi:DUF3263 domain-containing protein [uncultured Nocardioides sp.]|uniref:DUF3263 domain-containing protein n=1 Tax=uncultured Nocardioides sp. TaxID=198441 RepID=UPI0026181891|nr:DUF3263 domain-containing protein [uncultured Nocardioides sp.]
MSAPSATQPAVEPLTDQQRAVLEIERIQWPATQATAQGPMISPHKRGVIFDSLGISETRYAMILNALLSNPAAEAYDPHLIHRLQWIRGACRQRTLGRRPV